MSGKDGVASSRVYKKSDAQNAGNAASLRPRYFIIYVLIDQLRVLMFKVPIERVLSLTRRLKSLNQSANAMQYASRFDLKNMRTFCQILQRFLNMKTAANAGAFAGELLLSAITSICST